MHKILCTFLLIVCFMGCGGCKLVENMVNDVVASDLSICVDEIDVCWELSTEEGS